MFDNESNGRINRLFDCLTILFGERFSKIYANSKFEPLVKAIWLSALVDITDDEINAVLRFLKTQHEKYFIRDIPNHFEFHRLAKGYAKHIPKPKESRKWKKRS